MPKSENNIVKVVNNQGPMGWILFTAYIGAVIYFFQLDPTFWNFFLALLKAIFWPAFVLYQAMGALGIS